jgi:hypothetical protein
VYLARNQTMPQRCGFDQTSQGKRCCSSPQGHRPRVPFTDHSYRVTHRSLERAQNGVPIIREHFRFRSLNMKWPYIRTLHGFGQDIDFLWLSENYGTHPPWHRAKGHTYPSKNLLNECEIQEAISSLGLRKERTVCRLRPLVCRSLLAQERLPWVAPGITPSVPFRQMSWYRIGRRSETGLGYWKIICTSLALALHPIPSNRHPKPSIHENAIHRYLRSTSKVTPSLSATAIILLLKCLASCASFSGVSTYTAS